MLSKKKKTSQPCWEDGKGTEGLTGQRQEREKLDRQRRDIEAKMRQLGASVKNALHLSRCPLVERYFVRIVKHEPEPESSYRTIRGRTRRRELVTQVPVGTAVVRDRNDSDSFRSLQPFLADQRDFRDDPSLVFGEREGGRRMIKDPRQDVVREQSDFGRRWRRRWRWRRRRCWGHDSTWAVPLRPWTGMGQCILREGLDRQREGVPVLVDFGWRPRDRDRVRAG